MNTSKRIAAAVIIAGLSLYPLAVSGCSGTAHKGANEKVSENDEWYSLKKVTIGQKYEKDLDIDWIDSDFVELAGDIGGGVFAANALNILAEIVQAYCREILLPG